MRFLKYFLAGVLLCHSVLPAAEPLKIGITPYNPPFIFQTSANSYYGFDISMMLDLCKSMKRECSFKPMDFEELIDNVAKGDTPIALSSLTITTERSQKVNFTTPYIPSECQFMAKKNKKDLSLSLDTLNKQTFGIVRGNIFNQVIRSLGVTNASIEQFRDTHELINALNDDDISMIMLDTPTAFYWQMESQGRFVMVGESFQCGLGLGIAVNKNESDLLDELNKAILQYQQTEDFKREFNRFIKYK